MQFHWNPILKDAFTKYKNSAGRHSYPAFVAPTIITYNKRVMVIGKVRQKEGILFFWGQQKRVIKVSNPVCVAGLLFSPVRRANKPILRHTIHMDLIID